jgi:hypothetical protein
MAAEQQFGREQRSIRRAHEKDVVDRHLFFLFVIGQSELIFCLVR